MRDKLNCPNCGAPIIGTECPYCGTVFYDFATLDSMKPTYVRMKWHGVIIVAHVLMQSATMAVGYNEGREIEVRFMVLPGADGVMIKKEKRPNESKRSDPHH